MNRYDMDDDYDRIDLVNDVMAILGLILIVTIVAMSIYFFGG
ncbi:MAG TPA: hypothetical protein VFM18_10980 [Methanosarcina sp.]|nr:hypothetical protein [Methanosarcina sp.]